MTISSGKKLVAAICLTIGLVVPGVASAHAVQQPAYQPDHRLLKAQDFRVEIVPGWTHISIRASWTAGHSHCRLQNWKRSDTIYRLTIHPQTIARASCFPEGRGSPAVGCIRRDITQRGVFEASYSETILGLMPETTYSVHLSGTTYHPHSRSDFWIEAMTQITTTTIPPQPPLVHTHDEVPEHTHENPEPPQTCTYKHRLIGVPGYTGGGYTGEILISSEESKATARIRAYQKDNGQPIDVLDSEGSAIGSTVSLAPAHSVKRFRLEGVPGWHSVIVEHPSRAAMENATVAMRFREPDAGVSIEHVQGVERCITAGTNTFPLPEPETPPLDPNAPAPDLTVINPQVLLRTNTLYWRATIENIGDATAPETTARLYYDDGLYNRNNTRQWITSHRVGHKIAAGSQWPMFHSININRAGIPPVDATVRICVDPVPGEPAANRADNCANVTVRDGVGNNLSRNPSGSETMRGAVPG